MQLSEKSVLQQYFNDIGPRVDLSREEERALIKKARDGDRAAYQEFINSYLRLVVGIALSHSRKSRIEVMDLIQEGNHGLIRAYQKFELERDVAFTTYAGYWIRSYIMRYIMYNSPWRSRSQKTLHQFFSLQKEMARFQTVYGRTPEVEEMAEYFDVDEEQIEELLENNIRLCYFQTLRYEEGPGGNTIALEDVADEKTPTPYDVVCLKELEGVKTLIRSEYEDFYRSRYSRSRQDISRDIDVYFSRLEGRTLQEIGNRYDVSRERIRQIEVRAKKIVNRILLLHGLLDPETLFY